MRDGCARTVKLSLWSPSLLATPISKISKPPKPDMSYCKAASFMETNPNTGSLAHGVTGSENAYLATASAKFPDLRLSKTRASSTSMRYKPTAQIRTVKEINDGDRQQ